MPNELNRTKGDTPKDFITLGIESSCDETAIGIYSEKLGLIAHQLHSQIAVHNEYGGVVPELASRDHIKRTTPLIQSALKEADIKLSQINAIAYTGGPGLAGALLVGSSVAKALAYGLGIPALSVNHMEGHLLAPLLETDKPSFPFVCLLVSGGHSMLLEVQGLGDYRLLGESLDDAVGEAFDKTAKLLGLGYPGGAVLSNLAKQGTPNRFIFPRPMLNKNTLDFSFSGLKTFAKNTFFEHQAQDELLNTQLKADIAHAFESAATDVLLAKTKKALMQTGLKTLVVAGGVSANQPLQEKLDLMAKDNHINTYYPRLEFCTDNGAMIALAGHLRLIQGQRDSDNNINIQPRWALDSLQQPLKQYPAL